MFMYIFTQCVHSRAQRSHLILFSGGSGGKGSKSDSRQVWSPWTKLCDILPMKDFRFKECYERSHLYFLRHMQLIFISQWETKMQLDVDGIPPAIIMTFRPGVTNLTFDLDLVTLTYDLDSQGQLWGHSRPCADQI